MTKDIKKKLQEWAKTYHCADFIQNDPVQFPHRYRQKQDIEISGLLTAIMSFGNRFGRGAPSVFRTANRETLCFSGSIFPQSSEEAEYVSPLDDT